MKVSWVDYYRIPIAEVLNQSCPYCLAEVKVPCVGAGGFPHLSRRGLAYRARKQATQ